MPTRSKFETLVSKYPLTKGLTITSIGEVKMLRKTKVAIMALLASVMLLASPLMFVQGQTPTLSAEKMVWIAERANQQVQNLIDLINANDDATTKIADTGLTSDFNAAVDLYQTDGWENLEAAQEALVEDDYETASDCAVEALRVFREVYSSIHVIMDAADLERNDLLENQGLLEAITRELLRIERLGEILPDYTPEDILDSLGNAAGMLSTARTLLLAGDVDGARSAFLEAKDMISEVYIYLKEQAVDYNTWRLYNYCEQARERIREKFRYGRDEGVDFSDALQSFGYQSEEQFMEAFQNWAQNVQGEQDFEDAMRDCQELSRRVQQMEQALNEEIGRHKAQHGNGSGGSSSGSGSSYGGNESAGGS